MMYLLKPNLFHATQHNLSMTTENCTKVLRRSNNLTNQYEVVAVLFHGSSLDLVIAYNPLHRSSCTAIGNMSMNGGHVLCVYDTHRCAITSTAPQRLHLRYDKLVYSPDGTYLAVLAVPSSKEDTCTTAHAQIHSVLIYKSPALSVLRQLYTHDLARSEVNLLPTFNHFPLFSKVGDFLALGGTSESSECVVDIYCVPVQISLQNICRIVLNRAMTSYQISRLSVKEDLKDYLAYKPLYE